MRFPSVKQDSAHAHRSQIPWIPGLTHHQAARHYEIGGLSMKQTRTVRSECNSSWKCPLVVQVGAHWAWSKPRWARPDKPRGPTCSESGVLSRVPFLDLVQACKLCLASAFAPLSVQGGGARDVWHSAWVIHRVESVWVAISVSKKPTRS